MFDRFAILAFEAVLDRNTWLWAQLAGLEQNSRRKFGLHDRSPGGQWERELTRPLCNGLLRSNPLA